MTVLTSHVAQYIHYTVQAGMYRIAYSNANKHLHSFLCRRYSAILVLDASHVET